MSLRGSRRACHEAIATFPAAALDFMFMSVRLHDMDTTRKASEDGVYTLRMPREKLAKLHAIAESEHRSLAGKIRAWADSEIAAHEERQAA